jgi:hypothetical protein
MIATTVFKSILKIIRDASHPIIEGRRKNNFFSFFILVIETPIFKSTLKIISDASHTIIEGRRKNRNMNE